MQMWWFHLLFHLVDSSLLREFLKVAWIFSTPYILPIDHAKTLVSLYGDVPSHSTYCGSTLLREPVPGPLQPLDLF